MQQLGVCMELRESLACGPVPGLLSVEAGTCANTGEMKSACTEDPPTVGETLIAGLPERDIQAMIDLFQLLQSWGSST
jgi:hypothetical protein